MESTVATWDEQEVTEETETARDARDRNADDITTVNHS